MVVASFSSICLSLVRARTLSRLTCLEIAPKRDLFTGLPSKAKGSTKAKPVHQTPHDLLRAWRPANRLQAPVEFLRMCEQFKWHDQVISSSQRTSEHPKKVRARLAYNKAIAELGIHDYIRLVLGGRPYTMLPLRTLRSRSA
ncbi:hypothetical protein FA95DRAFT_1566641 [Auriscalpium vulgare]|uniref:Uncharacterized protein n=1 Tax=Auriscalpium vulgare TaxID=40419 RepID=A0ACB8R808_9AGAM|nr:hypothetical protein FA95DRAFT_1566641 [Auriscalpium vulgare]